MCQMTFLFCKHRLSRNQMDIRKSSSSKEDSWCQLFCLQCSVLQEAAALSRSCSLQKPAEAGSWELPLPGQRWGPHCHSPNLHPRKPSCTYSYKYLQISVVYKTVRDVTLWQTVWAWLFQQQQCGLSSRTGWCSPAFIPGEILSK